MLCFTYENSWYQINVAIPSCVRGFCCGGLLFLSSVHTQTYWLFIVPWKIQAVIQMSETCGGRRYTKKYLRLHGIGELKKGELHGYHAKNSKTSRRSALRKTVRSVGPLSTFRKLNALAVYTKNSAPTKSKTIKTDRNWVKKTYMK
jgi:hypothetical protein